MLAMGIVVNCTCGSLYAFGVYSDYIKHRFGYSQEQVPGACGYHPLRVCLGVYFVSPPIRCVRV